MDYEMKKYTCVICYKLFDEATALNTCRHIFCWKCIHGKITEHDWRCCPICYGAFGPEPLIRLSHDDPLLLTYEGNIEDDESDVDMEESSESSDDDEETETDDSDNDMETAVIQEKDTETEDKNL